MYVTVIFEHVFEDESLMHNRRCYLQMAIATPERSPRPAWSCQATNAAASGCSELFRITLVQMRNKMMQMIKAEWFA